MSASEYTKSILEEREQHDTPLAEAMELQEYDETEAAAQVRNPFAPSHIKNNNNHHVVPVGVLIVLCTLYLTSSALQRNCELNHDKQNALQDKNYANADITESGNEEQRNVFESSNILERFLEHSDVCFALEIFTKQLVWPDHAAALDEKGIKNDDTTTAADRGFRMATRRKQAPQKTTTARSVHNGHNSNNNNNKHNNKSAKIKYNQNKNDAIKKEKEQIKKNSTAEPIIYLFALVFIYLLLKAASDINQHYKSKSKGDKRLRRCSLQSYAQTHKQDRRASKDKRQRLLESRCQSVDRHNTPTTISEERDTLAKFRQNDALEQPQAGIGFVELVKPAVSKPEISKVLSFSSPAMVSRRCSVPNNSLNYRRPQSLTSVGVGVAATAAPMQNPIVAGARRTSIAGSSGLGMLGMAGSSFDGGDPLFPEVKRRVRMINRH